MSNISIDLDDDNFEARCASLFRKRDELEDKHRRIEALLNARKQILKEKMEQAKLDGFNPDNLSEDIRREKEVLTLKLNIFESELEAAEAAIQPMLSEISKA